MKIKKFLLLCAAAILVFSVCLNIYLGLENLRQRSFIDELEAKNASLYDILKEPPKGFYQKLQRGNEVSILVVGDSIGLGMGASEGSDWVSLLSKWIEDTYHVSPHITNVSMGGNTSYAGYVRTMVLDDGAEYDLAIVCFGENDDKKDFPIYYEALVRSVIAKYSRSSLILILESSQRKYTEKIEAIKEIADYYGIPAADTIAAFSDSGLSYEELTADDKHPNDRGYELYFKTISDIIKSKAEAYEPFKGVQRAPLNPGTLEFEGFYYIDEAAFTRDSDVSFKIPIYGSLFGRIGVFRTLVPGNNSLIIEADGERVFAESRDWNYDGSLTTIDLITDKAYKAERELVITFGSKEAADGFKGVTFTNSG